jgi:hypothetical protein
MVEFEISANKLYSVLSVLIIIMAGAVVYAYDSGGPSTTLGHAADEIDWSEEITQLIVRDLTVSSSLDVNIWLNAHEGIEVDGIVRGLDELTGNYITSPVIMSNEFCVGNYATAYAECISDWNEVIPESIESNSWALVGAETVKVDWNGVDFEWESEEIIYSFYYWDTNPTCDAGYAGQYRYKVVDEGDYLHWVKNYCHYDNAPVYQWSAGWYPIENPPEPEAPAYKPNTNYYSDINSNMALDRTTFVKMVMRSPDMSCSACGVEGEGVWVCEPVSCPIN